MEFSKLLGYTQDAMNAYSVGQSLGNVVNPDYDNKQQAIKDFSSSLYSMYNDKRVRDKLSKMKKDKDSKGNKATSDTGGSDSNKTISELTGNKATATPQADSGSAGNSNMGSLSKFNMFASQGKQATKGATKGATKPASPAAPFAPKPVRTNGYMRNTYSNPEEMFGVNGVKL